MSLPILFKARVLPTPGDQGDMEITAYSSDMRGFDLRIKNGVLYLVMSRENLATLRDVLSVAIPER